MSDTLPPLPEPETTVLIAHTERGLTSTCWRTPGRPYYTADQMRSYAAAALAAAVAAERERCARLCESMHQEDGPHAYAWAIRTEWAADAPVAAAVAEPVAYKCWHPVARAFYLSTEPPAPTRPDTGEPDEYFGGKVEPLYAAPPQREPEFLPLLLRDLCRELGASVPEAAALLREAGLGDFSQGAAVTPEMARCLHSRSVTPAPPQRDPQWQPIETAPKDGTRVLIYMPESSSRKVQEAYWATPWEGAPDEQCWWSTPFGPAGRGYTILPVAVTHWMPLPDPPASAPKEQA